MGFEDGWIVGDIDGFFDVGCWLLDGVGDGIGDICGDNELVGDAVYPVHC